MEGFGEPRATGLQPSHAAPTELHTAGGRLRYKHGAPTGACTDPCEDPCKEQGRPSATPGSSPSPRGRGPGGGRTSLWPSPPPRGSGTGEGPRNLPAPLTKGPRKNILNNMTPRFWRLAVTCYGR